jgi:hypothetical protein
VAAQRLADTLGLAGERVGDGVGDRQREPLRDLVGDRRLDEVEQFGLGNRDGSVVGFAGDQPPVAAPARGEPEVRRHTDPEPVAVGRRRHRREPEVGEQVRQVQRAAVDAPEVPLPVALEALAGGRRLGGGVPLDQRLGADERHQHAGDGVGEQFGPGVAAGGADGSLADGGSDAFDGPVDGAPLLCDGGRDVDPGLLDRLAGAPEKRVAGVERVERHGHTLAAAAG